VPAEAEKVAASDIRDTRLLRNGIFSQESGLIASGTTTFDKGARGKNTVYQNYRGIAGERDTGPGSGQSHSGRV
jgi:hypothetical protein